ncbi:MAG: tetratricopeptide repeat protein [Myxococcota bacterium]
MAQRGERAFRRGVDALGLAALLALAASGCSAEEKREAQHSKDTRAIMAEIYDALRVALPTTADMARFSSPEERPRIQRALDQLAANADRIEVHTRPEGASTHFLARSVARDAHDVERAYRNGQDARAAFLLQQITENCVACHTRLPSKDTTIADGFLDQGAMEELALESRAGLLMATRRFDDALVTLEKLLTDPDEHPALLMAPLTDYLVLNLRVKDDYERPVPTLRKVSQHSHIWEQLRRDIEGWITALPALHERTRGSPRVDTAREIVNEGRERNRLGDEQSGLVQFVSASAVLERFLSKHPHAEPGSAEASRLGEAYYLLGLVEARIGRNYWVSEAPFLLERAIRIAPREPYALEAYRRLENEVLMQYEGSDEEDIDPEEQRRLGELRILVEPPPPS